MSKIIFITKDKIQLEDKALKKDIFDECSKKINKKTDQLLFLYKGKILSLMKRKSILN